MNIVLIGAGGKIGSVLYSHLQRKNNVMAYDLKEDLRLKIKALDINDSESLGNLIEQLHIGGTTVDHVINAAYPRSTSYGKNLPDVSLEDFNANINVHLGGYFNVLKNFSELLVSQGGGGIINFSSVYGSVTPRFDIYPKDMTMPIEYAAIKSAINSISKYFLAYYKKRNLRINVVSPGGILDDQPREFIDGYNDLCINHGMINASDLVGVVDLLVDESGRSINGQVIRVDDGFCL